MNYGIALPLFTRAHAKYFIERWDMNFASESILNDRLNQIRQESLSSGYLRAAISPLQP